MDTGRRLNFTFFSPQLINFSYMEKLEQDRCQAKNNNILCHHIIVLNDFPLGVIDEKQAGFHPFCSTA
jgi:hypothetical protein